MVYANLPVPGDPEATWQHQRRLETRGLCPIPVVEVAQDHRVLGRYLEAGYHHIALSPPPGPRRPGWDLDTALPWLRRGFQLAGPGVGFHLLGATNWSLVAALPWYSADVHGWSDGLGREELVWFDSGPGCFRRVAMGESDRWQILGADGTDPALGSAYERRAVLAGLAAEAWQAAQTWLRDEFGPVISPEATGPGRGCTWSRWGPWSWPIAGSRISPPRWATSGRAAATTPSESGS